MEQQHYRPDPNTVVVSFTRLGPRCLVAFLSLLGVRCRSELWFTDRTVCAGVGRLEDGTGSREEGDSPLRPATPQDDILVAAVSQIPTQ